MVRRWSADLPPIALLRQLDLTGFRSKQGRPFAAGVRLSDDLRPEFDFGQASGAEGEASPDFAGQEPLGACPKCGSRVYEHGVTYSCE